MAIKPKKQAANLGPYVDLNSCQLVVCTRRAAMEISSFMRPSLFQAHNYSKLAHRIGASALLYMRCEQSVPNVSQPRSKASCEPRNVTRPITCKSRKRDCTLPAFS